MLMLARKLGELDGMVTVERIKAARGAFRPFDRNHTPGGNYARLGSTRALNGATIGIIGLGEIGHELQLTASQESWLLGIGLGASGLALGPIFASRSTDR